MLININVGGKNMGIIGIVISIERWLKVDEMTLLGHTGKEEIFYFSPIDPLRSEKVGSERTICSTR